MKNGAPDEMLQRPQAGRSPPYEVWRFRSGKDRYYIFVDRANGLGNYQLVNSNDVKEPGQPNWQELLHKEDAVEDISRFLGSRPRRRRASKTGSDELRLLSYCPLNEVRGMNRLTSGTVPLLALVSGRGLPRRPDARLSRAASPS